MRCLIVAFRSGKVASDRGAIRRLCRPSHTERGNAYSAVSSISGRSVRSQVPSSWHAVH